MTDLVPNHGTESDLVPNHGTESWYRITES